MTQGFTYTSEQIVEILSDYNTGHTTIQGVDTAPGWEAFGGFQPDGSYTATLRVTGGVSGPGLTMSVRVYRLSSPAGQVGPTVNISSEDILAIDAPLAVDLVGGVDYQVQAQVIGGSLEGQFGVVHSVELV